MRPWICPYCNVRHGPEQDAFIGEARVTPDGALYVHDKLVALSPQQRLILLALARAPGRLVSQEAMVLATGTRSENERNAIGQSVFKLNRRLAGVARVVAREGSWSIHPLDEL